MIICRPVSDSECSKDEKYIDNEVDNEDKQVNDSEYDDEKQALSSIISSEVEDTLANKFFSWLKTSNGGEETSVILKSIKLTYQYCVI